MLQNLNANSIDIYYHFLYNIFIKEFKVLKKFNEIIEVFMIVKGLDKISDIKKLVDDSKSIVILSHEEPDGDAIGSSLALYNYLKMYFTDKDVFKNIEIVLRKMPKYFVDLQGYNEVKSDIEGEVDLAIVVDLNDKSRLGELAYIVDKAKNIIVIDHHGGEGDFGEYRVIDKSSASTTMVLNKIYLEITKDYNIVKPSKEVIESLLVGVITDTSGFKNANTNREVFEFIIKALEYDVDINSIINDVLR